MPSPARGRSDRKTALIRSLARPARVCVIATVTAPMPITSSGAVAAWRGSGGAGRPRAGRSGWTRPAPRTETQPDQQADGDGEPGHGLPHLSRAAARGDDREPSPRPCVHAAGEVDHVVAFAGSSAAAGAERAPERHTVTTVRFGSKSRSPAGSRSGRWTGGRDLGPARRCPSAVRPLLLCPIGYFPPGMTGHACRVRRPACTTTGLSGHLIAPPLAQWGTS